MGRHQLPAFRVFFGGHTASTTVRMLSASNGIARGGDTMAVRAGLSPSRRRDTRPQLPDGGGCGERCGPGAARHCPGTVIGAGGPAIGGTG